MVVFLRYKEASKWEKDCEWLNPKCQHVQKFRYSMPLRCSTAGCEEKNMDVDKLLGDSSQSKRVKYFIDGVL